MNGMQRRKFVGLIAAAAAPAQVRRTTLFRSPKKGVAVMAYAFYTKPTDGDMLSIEQHWSRSDTVDVAYERRSKDHGETWSEPERIVTGERRPGGMWRKHPRCGVVLNGKFLQLWSEGVLPTDDPLEGLRQWTIHYRVDGGPVRQLIHKGSEYSPAHPAPGVWTGKTCIMLGDNTCVPVSSPDGTILLPVQMSVAGEDGKLLNPGGGYTWTESAVMIGKWRGSEIEWEMSERVKGDPSWTTRGAVEPTLGFLADGRALMVLRGSNDVKRELPGYKWISISSDGGRKWKEPRPWTYDDGTKFFSPSACSQLVRHSSGRLYWVGNITPENPKGNRPRYPLVIGEVDRSSGLLRRESVQTIDTLQPGEDPLLTLSNFHAREDRRTKEIAVHVTRLFAKPDGWEGDALVYRVQV
jgi:hypothetical protein